jgi:hypothetical protein
MYACIAVENSRWLISPEPPYRATVAPTGDVPCKSVTQARRFKVIK